MCPVHLVPMLFKPTSQQVESTVLRVHKRNFEIESQVFRDMFCTPQADCTEGKSDEHPLFLDGIRYQDFLPLMKVLFDRYAV